MSSPRIRKGHHERPVVAVTCSCGRPMYQKAALGPDTYRCGCGSTVKVDVPARVEQADRACGVLIAGGQRCGRHVRNAVADVGGICSDCLRRLLDSAAANPDWRGHLLTRFTAMEVDHARIERDTAAEKRAREEAAAEEARRAAAREADAIHVVYYVRTGDRTIKIGTTGHLEERMRAFRVANPDNLLAAERGDRELEQQRHRQFHAWRYHRRREDFGDALELLEHIAAVRGEHGDPWILGGAR